jgi:hypothetical protein
VRGFCTRISTARHRNEPHKCLFWVIRDQLGRRAFPVPPIATELRTLLMVWSCHKPTAVWHNGIAETRTLALDLAQGLASRIMLKGVSVAFWTWPNPPSLISEDNLAKPACAPSAAPTGWSRDVGTQIIVEPA